MHPQIVRNGPGSCPICGMSLEPLAATGEGENPELKSMTRRFWIGVALGVPLLFMVMTEDHRDSLSFEGSGTAARFIES